MSLSTSELRIMFCITILGIYAWKPIFDTSYYNTYTVIIRHIFTNTVDVTQFTPVHSKPKCGCLKSLCACVEHMVTWCGVRTLSSNGTFWLAHNNEIIHVQINKSPNDCENFGFMMNIWLDYFWTVLITFNLNFVQYLYQYRPDVRIIVYSYCASSSKTSS